MKKVFDYCFEKWWRPILFSGLTTGLYAIAELTKVLFLQNAFFLLFGLGLLGLLISIIHQFAKNRSTLGIVCTAATFGVLLGAFFMYSVAMFFITQSAPDKFADNLKMPTHVKVYEPLDCKDSLPIGGSNFNLYNAFQSGIYTYSYCTGYLEKGTIYLKAYEYTHNVPLSTNRLMESSSTEIENLSKSLKTVASASEFTIYEGDWGKPYAARFELWFKPSNGGRARKLVEKVYKIEGWMR